MPVNTTRNKRKIIFPQHHVLNNQATKIYEPELITRPGNHSIRSDPEPVNMDGVEDLIETVIPPYFLTDPILQNSMFSPTSLLQSATISECLPFLNGLNNPTIRDFTPFDYSPNGVLTLQIESHVAFLEDALSEYPAPFVGIDASRPWMVYWALLALHFLNQDISVYKDRVIKTFVPLQNATGGFGGGEGHLSHLAGTYAALLCLALVGGETAWGVSNREAMWRWLGRLKQPGGGFRICEGGEEDVRGAYCAMITIALLNLPWELPDDAPARSNGMTNFGAGLGEYLSRCQTYEGGISATPGNEAHGAYAFCAIACLCLLDHPDHTLHQYLDVDALIGWLSSRQYAPEGGFAGRTNKVVDGCYSHWLGGCWPLVLAALNGPKKTPEEDGTGTLYSTEGLARYILNCCQSPDGGLRDKPSKRPDAYHTCYTLAGVSTTEHYHYYSQPQMNGQFTSALTWKVKRNEERRRSRPQQGAVATDDDFKTDCGLKAVHPVFVIPHDAVTNMRKWALTQESFS
jgi:protein farnesyltransferase subunit beta